MIHVVAFGSSITNSGALVQINQIPDGIIPPAGNGLLIPPQFKYILGVAAIGASITRAQLASASFRDYGNMDLLPVNIGTVYESPVRWQNWLDQPLPISGPVELDAFAAQAGAGAEFDYLIAWLWDGVLQKPTRRPLSVHATASATLVAKKWTAVAMTLDNGLDQGTYALVGARAKSATGLAFRVVPNDNSSNRCGGLMVQAVDGYDLGLQRLGGLGTWTTFTNYNLPQFEYLAVSADSSEDMILDLIPL
jgi:hypothetical protein